MIETLLQLAALSWSVVAVSVTVGANAGTLTKAGIPLSPAPPPKKTIEPSKIIQHTGDVSDDPLQFALRLEKQLAKYPKKTKRNDDDDSQKSTKSDLEELKFRQSFESMIKHKEPPKSKNISEFLSRIEENVAWIDQNQPPNHKTMHQNHQNHPNQTISVLGISSSSRQISSLETDKKTPKRYAYAKAGGGGDDSGMDISRFAERIQRNVAQIEDSKLDEIESRQQSLWVTGKTPKTNRGDTDSNFAPNGHDFAPNTRFMASATGADMPPWYQNPGPWWLPSKAATATDVAWTKKYENFVKPKPGTLPVYMPINGGQGVPPAYVG
mmetsp:Transcript_9932/g.18096  ORF Transcript_9932/g.18096 Transcript_9932/m.18096 type:complete len:325 (+) Transcript_9932:100-1074(+)